jgi:O-antigen/teichoic acid export membrane protein
MRSANRVALNTLVQYIQLILNVLIGLYSVRVILDALGASDYGVYDLIAGVVSLLSFISTSLSQTSMRFLSVSLGINDREITKRTFSVCFWLHLVIALALSIILIALGFLLFNGFLNIPDDRVHTAKVLYYIMIFGLFLNISVTPFNAMISAHEKFVYISCVQIIDSLLKLSIAFVIAASSWDKLLLYGVLVTGVTVVNVLCYVAYSLHKYNKEVSISRVKFVEMKEVTQFAGWTLMDVFGSVATRQGYAILLNTYFGTVVNAVFALSRQVEGQVYTISASVINTMKPQIMKSHGTGDEERMFRLSLTAGKFGFSMMSLVAIPLLIMMPEVLAIWLKEVPEGTVFFSRLLVAACMCEQVTKGLVYANQAIGNIKWFSISISVIRILALPISWLLFHLGYPAYVAAIVFFICETVGSFCRVIILSRISDFRISSFVKTVFLQLLPPFFVSMIVCIVCYHYLSGVCGMLVVCFVNVLSYSLIMMLFGLTKEEKDSIAGIILSVSKGTIKLNI